MGVTTTKTNKPFNPRAQDASPLAYNRAALYSGKALDFDGVNDYVDCGTLDVTAYTGISMSFNFQLANITDNGLRLVSLLHSGTDDIRIEQGLSVLRITLDDGTSYTLETPSLTANEWNKFDMTFNGTTLEGYINGVSIGSISASFNFSTANGLLNLYKHTAASSYTEGLMAGFKIFNTALTAAQIADLYNFPEKILPTGVDNTALKLWLPMMESAGTTAYDGSGNGNHGTISGATYVNGVGAPVAQTSVIDWNKGVNLLTYSEQIDNAAYTNGGGAGSSIVRTANYGTAPNGTETADRLQITRGTSYSELYQRRDDLTNSVSYTLAFWGKSLSGTPNLYTAWNGAYENPVTFTTEWVEYKYTFNAVGSGAGGGFNLVTFTGLAGTSLTADILIWGVSLQETSVGDSYIPTIATAQTTPVLLPQGLTTGRDITGVNLFENVRKQSALNLDGQSWAEVHDNASLDVTTAVTLELWYYHDTSTTNEGLLGRWSAYSPNENYLLNKSASEVRFYIFTTASTNVNAAISSDGWYHVVGTYDGANQRIYLNGVEITSTAKTGSIPASTNPVEIGRYYRGPYEQTGQLAQPRIYNRALTAEEVQRNYNAGKNIYS